MTNPFFKNNERRVPNRLRLFITKPFPILMLKYRIYGFSLDLIIYICK